MEDLSQQDYHKLVSKLRPKKKKKSITQLQFILYQEKKKGTKFQERYCEKYHLVCYCH